MASNFTVDRNGAGTHRDLIAAVKYSSPGGRIYLYPGQYAVNFLEINKDLVIDGDPENKSVIIPNLGEIKWFRRAWKMLILIRASVTLRHLVFDVRSTKDWKALQISSRNVIIEDCEFFGSKIYSTVGIGFFQQNHNLNFSNANAIIRQSRIANGPVGISVLNGSDVVLLDSQILDNDVGLLLAGSSTSTVKRCRFYHNRKLDIQMGATDIRTDDHSTLKVRDSLFEQSTGGILIADGREADVERSQFNGQQQRSAVQVGATDLPNKRPVVTITAVKFSNMSTGVLGIHESAVTVKTCVFNHVNTGVHGEGSAHIRVDDSQFINCHKNSVVIGAATINIVPMPPAVPIPESPRGLPGAVVSESTNGQVVSLLGGVIRSVMDDFGPTILEQPRRFEAVLNDYLGAATSVASTRDVRIALLALSAGVPQALQLSSVQERASEVGRWTNRLHLEFGTDRDLAQRVVEAWSTALS